MSIIQLGLGSGTTNVRVIPILSDGCMHLRVIIICVSRPTPPSRPNKVGRKCPSAHSYVHPSVNKMFFLISMKFGI